MEHIHLHPWLKNKSNNLYGTTGYGGLGFGTVFKITAAGKYQILYKFGRVMDDGEYPQGPVTLDSAGNIYGTTTQGGTYSSDCVSGCGTIFKLSSKGAETMLYKFVGGTFDGSWPIANVLLDGKGNLYGTASGFNSSTLTGVVWELTSKKVESILYYGSYLYLGYIARDATGNFYVTWINNGGIPDSSGGLFELSTIGVASYYPFYGPYDGLCPAPVITGPLAFIESNFYGVMSQGGAYATCNPDGTSLPGGGEVYGFDPAIGQQIMNYSFPDPSMRVVTDGWGPSGGVVAGAVKNLYGTTVGAGLYGYGTVFQLTKN